MKLPKQVAPTSCVSYFNDTIFNKMLDESNMYAVQKNPATTRLLCVRELEKYIGILVMSFTVQVSGICGTQCWSMKLLKTVCQLINLNLLDLFSISTTKAKWKHPMTLIGTDCSRFGPLLAIRMKDFPPYPCAMRYLCRYVLQKQGTIRDNVQSP